MADYHITRTEDPGFIPAYPHATSSTPTRLIDGVPVYNASFQAGQVDQCEKLDDNYNPIVLTAPLEN